MTLSVYSTCIPVVLHHLKSLDAILRKGEAYAQAKKIEPGVLLNSRLFPDMFPLVRQVQIASDTAKGAGARLAAIEVPKFEDNETTFSELYARVAKTIDFLQGITKEKFEGAETRQIQFKVGSREVAFTRENYTSAWVMPNLLFHITTAYNILRHNGVELGKRDFLGDI